MKILYGFIGLFILYAIIQFAIDGSRNTKILKENNKLLGEIRDLLKEQNKNTKEY